MRAVPNKYPLLEPAAGDAAGEPPESTRGDPDLLVSLPATGHHEVIVHSPEHVASMTALGPEQFRHAIEGWRQRSAAHAGAAYVHLMVNEGHAAGASLEHSHAQLYALDSVPATVAREREHFTAHNTRTMGGCLLCDLLKEEVRRRERVVAVDDHAVLLAPFASRGPYELQLVPRHHERSFADSDPAALDLLREGLQKLSAKLGGAAAAQPVGPDRAARGRPLPLARRRGAAADAARRLRARHGPVREHRAARAGGPGAGRRSSYLPSAVAASRSASSAASSEGVPSTSVICSSTGSE